MLPQLLDSLALSDPWTYLVVFLGVSLLMLWRLEAMLDHGLEGTALGTLMMPYCSGLGNLIFVAIMVSRNGAPAEVLTNCLVNNVTNLTLLLGVPALCWGLAVLPAQAKAAAGEVVLMAASSAAVSRLSPSSASRSTMVSSLANGALRRSSSCEPMPVASYPSSAACSFTSNLGRAIAGSTAGAVWASSPAPGSRASRIRRWKDGDRGRKG